MNTSNTNITKNHIYNDKTGDEVFTFLFIAFILYNIYKYSLNNCIFDIYTKFKTKIEKINRKRKANKFFTIYDGDETENQCLICLSEDNENTTILECKHIFHKKCITQWYLSSNHNNNNCPICREEIIP